MQWYSNGQDSSRKFNKKEQTAGLIVGSLGVFHWMQKNGRVLPCK
jgi:hypothetical protein